MNNISFDLSGKIKPNIIEVLSNVKRIADSLDIRFFVVGARARDLILEHCYNIKPQRITMDIDLGVEVASWKQFNKLTEALIDTGKCYPTDKPYRFLSDSVYIDIVPFGPIADGSKRISWPPEHKFFMSMLGFEEAYEYSMLIRLSSNPELDIKVPALPGLALMKIISWDEKYPERSKDAGDLLLIMREYGDAGNLDRLYVKEQGLLQEEGFDPINAGVRLLGRDMAKIANSDTLSIVRAILEGETGDESQYRLIRDMIKGRYNFGDYFDEVLLLVKKFKDGIEEGSK